MILKGDLEDAGDVNTTRDLANENWSEAIGTELLVDAQKVDLAEMMAPITRMNSLTEAG